jgi:oxygen-independent coproporphyrinogen-3 oxidase
LAGTKGHAFTHEDRLRARAIEMLMCDFRLDLDELREGFGETVQLLAPDIAGALQRFDGLLDREAQALVIRPEGCPLTRMIAAAFDAYVPDGARYSQAS